MTEVFITDKDGRTISIEQYIKERREGKRTKESRKLSLADIRKIKKTFQRRGGENINIAYRNLTSKGRHLTTEEIRKEYGMEQSKERTNVAREVIVFMQSLEGRKVAGQIVHGAVKRPVSTINSTLSQLGKAGILINAPIEGNKRKLLWGIAPAFLKGDPDSIVEIHYDYQRKLRKDLKERKAVHPEIEEKKEEELDISSYVATSSPEEVEQKKSEELGERLTELIDQEKKEKKEHTIKLVVEGNIKILFGLAR